MQDFLNPEIVKQIGNVGFPVAVAFYLLIRFEKKIENLTEAIHDLRKAVYKKKT